jgi:hypothetical protein
VTAPSDLEAYVEAIEAHMRTLRGRDHALSPRDFALAKGWHQAGVALATVLVAIDRAFEGNPQVSSLAYCRHQVEDMATAGPRPAAPGPAAERVPLSEVGEVLAALRERLLELPRAGFALPLQKIVEVQDLVAVSSRPNWDYLRVKLREIDDEVAAAALESLPSAEGARLRAEAERAAERHREKVDPASLEDALRRYLRQRARESLGLPRVSLL